MEGEIIIRKIDNLDIPHLTELYTRVWPNYPFDRINKTKWAVTTSPEKGFCAEIDGKIIGSRSSFFTNCYLGNSKLRCVQFGDSCVDVDYRGVGLFTKMNKAFLEAFFSDQEPSIIWNVSVDASKKAYEKLGWKYIRSLSGLYYISRPIRFLFKSGFHLNMISGPKEYTDAPIPDVSQIPTEFIMNREEIHRKNGQIHTFYDEDTLRWRVGSASGIRLFSKPKMGACFYKLGNRDRVVYLRIGEVFLAEGASLKSLIKELIRIHHADVVITSISSAHPLYKNYKRMGFINNPFKKYLNLGFKTNSSSLLSACSNTKNWALCNLDLDTF